MDLATLIGLGSGTAVVLVAIFLGGDFMAFVDVPSLLLVIGGAMAATILRFTLADVTIERAETILGAGRVRYVHPDCGFWMLRRSIADAKITALVAGRDLYEGRPARGVASGRGEAGRLNRTELGREARPRTAFPTLAPGSWRPRSGFRHRCTAS
jgi:hypothetical protein